eukprot:Rhum_TRINITY_DN12749_c1_g1::Rhum_TRINITY_DN12749_c1_g1_i1::g.54138::m.54138
MSIDAPLILRKVELEYLQIVPPRFVQSGRHRQHCSHAGYARVAVRALRRTTSCLPSPEHGHRLCPPVVPRVSISSALQRLSRLRTVASVQTNFDTHKQAQTHTSSGSNSSLLQLSPALSIPWCASTHFPHSTVWLLGSIHHRTHRPSTTMVLRLVALLAAVSLAASAAGAAAKGDKKVKGTKAKGTKAKGAGKAGGEIRVEAEWSEFMACSACEILSLELKAKSDESRALSNQKGRFKLAIEREEWVIERAVQAAATEYAFISTDVTRVDQERGQFREIEKILAIATVSEQQREAFQALREDPIYSLRTFLTSIIDEQDEGISDLIERNPHGEGFVYKLCRDHGAKSICKRPREFGPAVEEREREEREREKAFMKKANAANARNEKMAQERAARAEQENKTKKEGDEL